MHTFTLSFTSLLRLASLEPHDLEMAIIAVTFNMLEPSGPPSSGSSGSSAAVADPPVRLPVISTPPFAPPPLTPALPPAFAVMVLVDLSAGNTRSIVAPEGYRAFIASILAQAPVAAPVAAINMDDSSTRASVAAEVQVPAVPAQNVRRDPYGGQPAAGINYAHGLTMWPSGVPPFNVADSFTIFVCSQGDMGQMRLDAQTLATAIITRFPSLSVYGFTYAGLPWRF